MSISSLAQSIYYYIYRRKFKTFRATASETRKYWSEKAIVLTGYYDAYLSNDFFPSANEIVITDCDPLAITFFLTISRFPSATHIWIDKLPSESYVLDSFLALGVKIYTTPRQQLLAENYSDPYIHKRLEAVPEHIFKILASHKTV